MTRVQPDATIVHPLRKLHALIRVYVTLDVLLFTAAFATFWLWLGLAFDYGLFKLLGVDLAQQTPPLLRIVGWGFLGLVLLFIIGRRVFRYLTRDFSNSSLALVLEKRHPRELGDRLITAVELHDLARVKQDGYSVDMVRQTIEEARERVAGIRVGSVLRWGRIFGKVVLTGLFMLTGVVLAYSSYVAANLLRTKSWEGSANMEQFGHKFLDVACIYAERHLLLRNTPWPRRTLLAVIDPAGDELRTGQGMGKPRVKVRSYRWVHVDRSNYDGWRPMLWRDLPAHGIPAALMHHGTDIAAWTVDDVESKYRFELEDAFTQLEALAANPWNSRKVRKLEAQKNIELRYRGQSGKSAGAAEMKKEVESNDFVAEVDTDAIKESTILFTASADDFRTRAKRILLIPQPSLIDLYRDEYAPAYLYHAAPIDAPNAEQPQAALRGLRQEFRDKKINITGDRSSFTVPVGSELDITAVADRRLKSVVINTIIGKETRVLRWTREVDTEAEGFDTFTFPFRGPDAIQERLELECVMKDFDGVVGRRLITIQVAEDLPPVVDVQIEYIRKLGTQYLVTPVAMVPFTRTSIIKDDAGLSKVLFEFTYSQVESSVVERLNAQLAAAMYSAVGVPMQHISNAITLAVNDSIYQRYGQSSATRNFRSYPVMKFEEDYRTLPRENTSRLLAKLKEPRPSGTLEDVVRTIRLASPESDCFDLERAAPGLAAKEGEIQPSYKIDLTITAIDTNAEFVGKNGRVGRVSTNVEPISLKVISEQELLVEISKDEETEIGKLDVLLKRLVDAKAKFESEAALLRSPGKEQLENSRIRALDISQDIASSRKDLHGMVIVYDRLYNEIYFNRFNRSVKERYKNDRDDGILQIAKRIADGPNAQGDFVDLETAFAAFQSPLNAGNVPSDIDTNNVRNQFARTIAALEYLKAKTGSVLDKAKSIQQLQELLKFFEETRNQTRLVVDELREGAKRPSITPIKPVTVAVGKTASIRHKIAWKLYDKDALYLKIEGPDAEELKRPAELVIKDDGSDEFAFDVTGVKEGSFTLKLVPAVGKPVEVQVNVVK